MAVHLIRPSAPATAGRAAACTLSGELDMATAATVRDVVRAAWVSGGPDLLVDVSAVTFIDCSGLSPLVEMLRDVRAAGGRVTLVGPGPGMQRLLRFSGLSTEFDVAAADADATGSPAPGEPSQGPRPLRPAP